jgi:hypothetical protein
MDPWLSKPSENTMATPLDNIVMHWLCVCLPEHKAKMPSLGARRMLAKLGELHQPLCPRPTKNPGAAWGSTCLDRPYEQRPNIVLEAAVLRRDRPKAILWTATSRHQSFEVTLARFGIL